MPRNWRRHKPHHTHTRNTSVCFAMVLCMPIGKVLYRRYYICLCLFVYNLIREVPLCEWRVLFETNSSNSKPKNRSSYSPLVDHFVVQRMSLSFSRIANLFIHHNFPIGSCSSIIIHQESAVTSSLLLCVMNFVRCVLEHKTPSGRRPPSQVMLQINCVVRRHRRIQLSTSQKQCKEA